MTETVGTRDLYLHQLTIENLGPIEQLDLKPTITEDGFPVPVVLVGPNGSGKSLVLSVLMDSLVESQKQVFRQLHEVRHDQFLRLGSQRYVRSGSDYSSVGVEIGSTTPNVSYDELNTVLSPDEFAERYPALERAGKKVVGEIRESGGFFKLTRVPQPLRDRLKSMVALYFPFFRYERPAWLNPEAALAMDLKERMVGVGDVPVVQADLVHRTCQWLLDVVLDRELYEKTPTVAPTPTGPRLVISAQGPNNDTLVAVQKVLTAILRARDPAIDQARFAISRKARRQIAIHATRSGKEQVVSPSISQLSSGELMVLSMACAILRAHEAATGAPPAKMDDVAGMVLVDEIDLHLHIKLQREILPAIIGLFPAVQFIVSTHSPFFVMGMAESSPRGADIVALPHGTKVAPTEFSEFKAGYDTFIAKNDQFRGAYERVSRELAQAQRPLVVTEGKTDWKHLKRALERLQADKKHTGLDLAFLEYEDELSMGDSQLVAMCKQFAKTRHSRKVVFVFDRDVAGVLKEMGGAKDLGYRRWSDDVFSMCIPSPPHRDGYENVSIEFYYTDEEVHTADPSTGKRLFFTNEVELVMRPGGGRRVPRQLDSPKADEELAKKVFDQDCDQLVDANGVGLAHSKAVFGEKVLSRSTGYDGFGVEAFSLIFDVFEQILQTETAAPDS